MDEYKLLRNQFKLLGPTDNDTHLHTVVRQQNVNIVDTLINGGAEVNMKNVTGCTPLHIACYTRNVVIVEKLLFNGADVNLQDYLGDTPLHIALVNESVDIAQKLVARGADLKLKNRFGFTALHLAVKMSWSEFDNGLVKMLLENGTDVNAKDNDGLTPLDYALRQGFIDPSILDLRDWGAVFTRRGYHRSTFNSHVIIYSKLGLELLCESGVYDPYGFHISPYYLHNLLKELEKMKAKTFNQFSLYDVFRKWNDPLLLSTDDIEEFINSTVLDFDFPGLALFIRAFFLKNKRKLNSLYLIQQRVKVYLPEEIVRMILSYK